MKGGGGNCHPSYGISPFSLEFPPNKKSAHPKILFYYYLSHFLTKCPYVIKKCRILCTNSYVTYFLYVIANLYLAR